MVLDWIASSCFSLFMFVAIFDDRFDMAQSYTALSRTLTTRTTWVICKNVIQTIKHNTDMDIKTSCLR